MKKIFSYIILFFVICFSGIYSVEASSINITNSNSIFGNDVTQPYCANEGDCSLERGIEGAKDKVHGIEREGTAVDYIQKVVNYILGFLFVISVLFIIFAGFMILTSAGNDDRIEKAKKIIIGCIIGIIVIGLAYPITAFIVSIFENSK